MASVSLTNYPKELQLSILDLLDVVDLIPMKAVNKHFCALTEALIYKHIDITWRPNETPPITLLLRTLIDQPELCQRIRGLRLDGEGFTTSGGYPDEPPTLPVASLSIAKASELIRSSNVPYAQQWTEELQFGHVDAIVALLISMLPKLTTLHLGPNFTVESRLLGQMLRSALSQSPPASRLPAFEQLRQVTFCRRTNEYRQRTVNNSADVLPFFYLPAIHDLSVSIDNPKDFSWHDRAPTPSSLRSLEVYRLRENRLGPLLTTLSGLQKLHWHCFYQDDLDCDVSRDVVDLDEVTRALGRVGNTLIDLTIEAETSPAILAGDYEPPPLAISGSLMGLSRLRQVKKLCVPWVFLMGQSPPGGCRLGHLLPPTLQLLKLSADLDEPAEKWMWYDPDSIIQAIKTAVHDSTMSSLPDLRRIILPIPQCVGDLTEERRAQLRQLSDRVGIQLEPEDD